MLRKRKIAEILDEADLPLAPDFPEDLDWVNSAPLSWARLKGKLVLLVVWSYRSIYSEHAIDTCLEYLKRLHTERFAIVGVHVGGHIEAVREMIPRLGIQFPVVHDPRKRICKLYNIRELPTTVLIAPDQRLLLPNLGATWRFELFDNIVTCLQGPVAEVFTWNEDPLPLTQVDVPFTSPAGIATDPAHLRYYVSDSAQHVIRVYNAQDEELERIGSGKPSFLDGTFEEADFYRPRGLCFHQNKLYVADSGNHAIRCVDLESRQVTTLAGVGTQGYDYAGYAEPDFRLLNSPWDLTYANENLYITMAGAQQIWRYDFEHDAAYPVSGLGCEQHYDATHPMRAGWCQPHGITAINHLLFVADSRSHTVRCLDTKNMIVSTVARGYHYPQAVSVGTQPKTLLIADCDGVTEFNLATSIPMPRHMYAPSGHPSGIAIHPADPGRLILADALASTPLKI